jgi:hypothetical protein
MATDQVADRLTIALIGGSGQAVENSAPDQWAMATSRNPCPVCVRLLICPYVVG